MDSNGLQIFSIYYSKKNFFHHKSLKSEVIEPIQTGCDLTNIDLKMMKDNVGDNISRYNNFFGELTCWYYVWKNYLPYYPKIKYIGFTQYRRILGLFNDPKKNRRNINDGYFISISKREFINYIINSKFIFENWDVVLPFQSKLNTPLGERIRIRNADSIGSETFFNKIIKSLIEVGVDNEEINKYFKQKTVYYKCNFIMRRELFNDFMKWLFKFFNILDNKLTSTEKTHRCFAYVAESVIGIYFNRLKTQGFNVKHVYLYEARFYSKYIKDDIKKLKKNIQLKCFKSN